MPQEFLPMITAEIGDVKIRVVNGRTMTPEEWADLAVAKIIYIADSAAPEVRDSANAFKDRIFSVIAAYIRKAVEEDRAFREAQQKKEKEN